MNIARHQRENHDTTDVHLANLEGLIEALDDAVEMTLEGNEREARIVRSLVKALQSEVEKVQKTHAAEWVGLGGRSDFLTEEEAARARGEEQD